MTRAEAFALIELIERDVDVQMALGDYLASVGEQGFEPVTSRSKLRLHTYRERLADRLCGEEATQPLAGRAP